MLLNIPRFSLVFLIGTSGSGKSTFARKHFEPFEILSSDTFRGWVCNDENALDATSDAFEALYFILKKRLTRKLLTVIDATNLQDSARKGLLEIAKNFHCLSVAFVFHFPEKVCLERNRLRSDRQVPAYVIPQQYQQLLRAEKKLKKEGFHSIHRFETQTALDEVTLVREALWTERLEEKGPFDIIGDVHGCGEELVALLQKLGYTWEPEKDPRYTPCTFSHPQQRRIIFLGDLVDRGPQVPQVLRVAMQLCHQGKALLVPGNHEVKLVKALRGASVKIAHGLEQSLEQIHKEPPAFQTEVLTFLDRLVSHYLLDEGQLVVAHAGMKEDLQGRTSARVRDFALYGETTGEIDEFGLPVRYPWAESYRGKAMVVYGHTPVPSAEWLNHTINIDTGCVFGGELTALRYPEKELVAVKAKQVYFEPLKPFALQETASVIPPTAQQEHDRILHLEDVLGKRILSTRLRGKITLQEENTAAALEAISRFTINPQWLIYLPPTMSPAESSSKESFLEYPIEAFNYYRKQKINTLVCEEKHMGSRAIVVLCQNQETVQRCFGIKENTLGVCYTRRGRPFFEEPQREQEFLQELHRALTESHFWEKFNSSWFALDGEIMPWSAKAQDLLKQQYAAVGAASHHAFRSALPFLEKMRPSYPSLDTLFKQYQERAEACSRYVDAYRRYCWPVQHLNDLKFAPFHLLASEHQVFFEKDPLWHLQQLAPLAEISPLLQATAFQSVDLENPESVAQGVQWWEHLTEKGGEGMVVKPTSFLNHKALLQPAMKCRGREYLRIIYGPEYTSPAHLDRLKIRRLQTKRSLALREFALGVEALERFIAKEPLRRIHECVFAILALESEPVDPRL